MGKAPNASSNRNSVTSSASAVSVSLHTAFEEEGESSKTARRSVSLSFSKASLGTSTKSADIICTRRVSGDSGEEEEEKKQDLDHEEDSYFFKDVNEGGTGGDDEYDEKEGEQSEEEVLTAILSEFADKSSPPSESAPLQAFEDERVSAYDDSYARYYSMKEAPGAETAPVSIEKKASVSEVLAGNEREKEKKECAPTPYNGPDPFTRGVRRPKQDRKKKRKKKNHGKPSKQQREKDEKSSLKENNARADPVKPLKLKKNKSKGKNDGDDPANLIAEARRAALHTSELAAMGIILEEGAAMAIAAAAAAEPPAADAAFGFTKGYASSPSGETATSSQGLCGKAHFTDNTGFTSAAIVSEKVESKKAKPAYFFWLSRKRKRKRDRDRYRVAKGITYELSDRDSKNNSSIISLSHSSSTENLISKAISTSGGGGGNSSKNLTGRAEAKRAIRSAPWMCSLCGVAFTTVQDADVHERICIRKACNKRKFFHMRMGYPNMTLVTPTAGQTVVFSGGRKNGGPSTKPRPHRKRGSSLTVWTTYPEAQTGTGISPLKASSPSRESQQATTVSRTVSEAVSLTPAVRRRMRMTDESLVKVVRLSDRFMFTSTESDAERELALFARDRAHYDHMERRAAMRRETKGRRGQNPFRIQHQAGIISAVQNKLADAYELIKEGEEKSKTIDRYEHHSRGGGNAGGRNAMDIVQGERTLYINVLVKNSVQVLNSELTRLANQRWQEQNSAMHDPNNPFAQFRIQAQNYIVQLASLALENDFKPRRIAIQMSNDFYRLLVPELKRRGVTIEDEIEYRSGAYFVLAVNVIGIEWVRFVEHTHFDVKRRKAADHLAAKRAADASASATASQYRAKASSTEATKSATKGKKTKRKKPKPLRERLHKMRMDLQRRLFPSMFDAIAYSFYLLYYLHWIFAVPICMTGYLFLRETMHMYICQSVIDDLYRYAENKKMEMDMQVRNTQDQATFMLNVLRKMRSDERRHKKEKESIDDDQAGGGKPLLGNLLGPHIKDDKGPAKKPDGFELPENLDTLCLELNVPVGFRRLRWAILRSDSEFNRNAMMVVEEKYENIIIGQWSIHDEHIGIPNIPPDVDQASFIGAELEQSYLMPANAMVKANTAYDTLTIIEYNDYCFAFKKRTRTPEVPFGSSFFTWTQVIVYDMGNENSFLVCSSGAEFPNGRPMVGRQIESGIRSGTTEGFVRFGETISRYAMS